MITRAQIRRQLRKNGGIMNAVPRQKYGLGSKWQDFKDSAVDTFQKRIVDIVLPT